MSRAYRIQVKESETRTVKGEDEVCTELEILEVLPPEDMATLLREELKKRGFEEQEDGTLARKDGDITVTVDPCTGQITVKAKSEETVNQEVEKQGTGDEDYGAKGRAETERRTREAARADLDKKFDQERTRLQARATDILEKHLQDLQPEISEVVNQITRDALKQKAQQMGTVKEVSEDVANGSLTIKVEV